MALLTEATQSKNCAHVQDKFQLDFDSLPGLRTRSISNRVQVRIQEIFASPSSSSSSKNFICRVRQN